MKSYPVADGLALRQRNFWSHVKREQRHEGSSCWLWTGAQAKNGYGRSTAVENGVRSPREAHRVSYELTVGPVPAGLELDHLCRNRLCVRPSHLEAVTHRVNIERGTGPVAENARRTHCRRGHPFTGDNLYVVQASRKRRCRTCQRDRQRQYKRRARAAS